jgi:cysteine desulfurase family protein (TIGR01976 family)
MPTLAEIRSQFPALKLPYVFFDNPGGTQISQTSLDRINRYLLECNANHGGAFPTGRASDEMLATAHAAAADFLNAPSADEIVFGANMTTLTMGLSRAIALEIQAGDRLVVTRLDHDANISPWLRVAEDRGAEIVWVDIDPEDCTLNMQSFEKALALRPKLVAVGYASNAVGTINPVADIVKMAHAAGALVFIDAVQFAPHGSIDVQALGCDFLACSAYKFFGPHVGVLYGRYELLDRLRAYKVRPAPVDPPGKFETGTLNHEGIAGVLGALEYIAWLGQADGKITAGGISPSARRQDYVNGMHFIQQRELELSRALLDGLESIPGLRIYGITDRGALDHRVPTVSFTLQGWTPLQVAKRLGQAGINVWDGNYYALAVMERLDLERSGGMVRVGATHYNSIEEVARLVAELKDMTGG